MPGPRQDSYTTKGAPQFLLPERWAHSGAACAISRKKEELEESSAEQRIPQASRAASDMWLWDPRVAPAESVAMAWLFITVLRLRTSSGPRRQHVVVGGWQLRVPGTHRGRQELWGGGQLGVGEDACSFLS